MRQLIAIATVSLLLVLGATLLWGWPGAWGLLALAPGLLLGSVLAHLVDTWVRGTRPRLIFTTLSGSFGTLLALFSLMVMATASTPPGRQITLSRTAPLGAEALWAAAAPVELWGRWEALIREASPSEGGGPPAVGKRYPATMLISGREVPATLEVLAWEPRQRIAWQAHLTPGSAFEALKMDLLLTPTDNGTTATFTLSYSVPGVTARAIERWALRPLLDASVAQSLDTLVTLAADLARGD